MTVAVVVVLIAAALVGLFVVRSRKPTVGEKGELLGGTRMAAGSDELKAYYADQSAIARATLLASIARGDWTIWGASTLVRVTAAIANDRLNARGAAAVEADRATLYPGPARTTDDQMTMRLRSFDAARAPLPAPPPPGLYTSTMGELAARGTPAPTTNAEILAAARTAAPLAAARIAAQHSMTQAEAVEAGLVMLSADGTSSTMLSAPPPTMLRRVMRREHNRDGSLTLTYSDGTTERVPAS